ncbi:reverse transcriptase domain-containing protein [Tanacetum coccineum]
MLARCDETNLVLNWEKCYFMVKEGIVLGHKVSSAWIEVDKAKVDVIAKLPYPTNVLMKETKFIFDKDCIKAFNILKKKLTTTPIINSSDWNLDFELMCDASDYAVETVLGQMVDKKFKPVYYATKTVNDSPEHYTTTEKELLVVFYAFDKFWSYLVVSKTIIYTDHYALKIENPELEELDEEAIRDSFPNKHLMAVHIKKPEKDLCITSVMDLSFFKSFPNEIMRSCVFDKELQEILEHFYMGPAGGHYGEDITARKVFEAGFY